MKFDSRLLLALAFVWGGGDAFMVPGPKAQTKVVVWKLSWKNNLATGLTEKLSGATGRGIRRGMTTPESSIADMSCARNIETLEITYMQDEDCALQTWSFPSPTGERFTRLVTTTGEEDRTVDTMTHDGRLIHARVCVCQGPNNTPVRTETKNGKVNCTPFKAGIERPEGYPSLFVPNPPAVGVAIEDPLITATGTPRTPQGEAMSSLSSISALTMMTVLNWTNLPCFAAIAASTAIGTVVNNSSVEAPLPWIVFFQKAFLSGGVTTFLFVPLLVFAYTGIISEFGAKLDKQQGEIVKQLAERFDQKLAESVKQQGEKIDSLVDKMFYRIENQDPTYS